MEIEKIKDIIIEKIETITDIDIAWMLYSLVSNLLMLPIEPDDEPALEPALETVPVREPLRR